MNESIAVVVAHPDDEALGCGGTIAHLAATGAEVHVLVAADGESSRGQGEATAQQQHRIELRRTAARRAAGILGCAGVEFLDFPDNRLDGVVLLDLVQRVEDFLGTHRASTVFTHHGGDVNVDHRQVHEAVVTACRAVPGQRVRTLLFFEVASSTEWRPPGSGRPFEPNWFVDVGAVLARKLEALRAYDSELRAFPHPRSLEAVEALARWRGASAGVHAAEAFVLGRRILP